MATLEQQFQAAVEKVRNAPKDGGFKPDNNYKLRMYALFRQATDGDVQGKRPGMLDVIGRFKYDAWTALKGTDKAQAMKDYIAEVAKVEKQYG
jgi:acyl-CoA-binding protein